MVLKVDKRNIKDDIHRSSYYKPVYDIGMLRTAMVVCVLAGNAVIGFLRTTAAIYRSEKNDAHHSLSMTREMGILPDIRRAVFHSEEVTEKKERNPCHDTGDSGIVNLYSVAIKCKRAVLSAGDGGDARLFGTLRGE